MISVKISVKGSLTLLPTSSDAENVLEIHMWCSDVLACDLAIQAHADHGDMFA